LQATTLPHSHPQTPTLYPPPPPPTPTPNIHTPLLLFPHRLVVLHKRLEVVTINGYQHTVNSLGRPRYSDKNVSTPLSMLLTLCSAVWDQVRTSKQQRFVFYFALRFFC
jgi:hypothetical protein